ncbi:META domain-containing protein [Desulfovibrio sp. OttesenSCG-928-M16]|nr:META domain-containing protein [Desulfovibrio sp. OttesenSCG-928-M16]
MKQTIYLCIVAALFAFGLTGCADEKTVERSEAATLAPGGTGPAASQTSAVNQADLLNGHFVLRSVNGRDYSQKERVPSLAFNQDFRISGGICNRYTGQAALEDGKLFVRNMASTKMLCVDEDLNKLESAFAHMLEQGADLSFDGAALTLSGKDLEMVFDEATEKTGVK